MNKGKLAEKELGVAVFFEKENINSLSEKSELMLTILSSLALYIFSRCL